MRILILEDNVERRVAMQRCIDDRFPQYPVEFFDASRSMIARMESSGVYDVILLSLDCDLELVRGEIGRCDDPGTGQEVAAWLAQRPAVCPAIVHTTNRAGGDWMVDTLRGAGWTVWRIVPYGGNDWIEETWFPAVRNAIVRNGPATFSSIGIKVLRSCLQRHPNLANGACSTAVAELLEAARTFCVTTFGSGGISFELFYLNAEDRWHPAIKSIGPLASIFATPDGVVYEELGQGAIGATTINDLSTSREFIAALEREGIVAIQVEVVEVRAPRPMQALLIATSRSKEMPLGSELVQSIMSDLKSSIEVSLLIGVESARQNTTLVDSELTIENAES